MHPRAIIPVHGPPADAPRAVVDDQTPDSLWCKVAERRKGQGLHPDTWTGIDADDPRYSRWHVAVVDSPNIKGTRGLPVIEIESR